MLNLVEKDPGKVEGKDGTICAIKSIRRRRIIGLKSRASESFF